MNYGFSRIERLHKSSQFLHVRGSGVSIRLAPFWVQMSLGSNKVPQLGIIASKRIGNAVLRNRAKRLIRELYRNHKNCFPPFSQTVIIPRKSIFKLPYSELLSSFKDVIEKASNKL